jgi:phosphate transport system substrate-binding protein
MNLFCGGVGPQHPDVTNASRRIKASEIETCNRNNVRQIIEIPVGIDGLALIESAQRPTGFQLTVRDVYAALAANPFGHAQPPKLARRQSFAPRRADPRLRSAAHLRHARQLCRADPRQGLQHRPGDDALKAQDEDRHKQTCTQIREDGAYIEAGENDNLLVQRVSENEGAIGVLGYSFLEENSERVRGIPIGGISPTAATIADFTYPGARKLYVYVKGEHLNVIPGLREFLTAWTQGWGPGGYLAQHG